jgi:GTP-binding protein
VGKSSFINALLGIERNIVTDVAGTTRDAIDTHFNSFGFDFLLVDTAGVRKKTKVSENIEFYSVMRSIRAIENSDVCLLMVDATQGFESQDLNILHLAEKNRKSIVIIVNKWDLIEKGSNTHKEFEALIRKKTSPFTDYEIIFTSVINKQRIFKALEAANRTFQNRKRKISTSVLNETLLPIIEKSPPPMYKGKNITIKYVTQLPTKFPSFAFFCNLPQYLKDPYKRFIENKLREQFDFTGIPVQLYFRRK